MFKWLKCGGSLPQTHFNEPDLHDHAAFNVVNRLARSIPAVRNDAAEVRGALEAAQRVVSIQAQAMQIRRSTSTRSAMPRRIGGRNRAKWP